MPDWIDDPEAQEWAQHVLDEVVPQMRDSAFVVSLMPTRTADIKFAVETGMAIMLDKPILLVVEPGTRVPPKLVAVADSIVEIDLDAPGGRQRLGEEIKRLLERDAE